jgi:hypothetical protein
VGDVLGSPHGIPRTGSEFLAVYYEAHGPGDNVKNFIFVDVPMQGRGVSERCTVIENGNAVAAFRFRHPNNDLRIEEPQTKRRTWINRHTLSPLLVL